MTLPHTFNSNWSPRKFFDFYFPSPNAWDFHANPFRLAEAGGYKTMPVSCPEPGVCNSVLYLNAEDYRILLPYGTDSFFAGFSVAYGIAAGVTGNVKGLIQKSNNWLEPNRETTYIERQLEHYAMALMLCASGERVDLEDFRKGPTQMRQRCGVPELFFRYHFRRYAGLSFLLDLTR